MNVAEKIWTIKTQNSSQRKNIGFINKKNDTICASIVYEKNVKQWKFLDHKTNNETIGNIIANNLYCRILGNIARNKNDKMKNPVGCFDRFAYVIWNFSFEIIKMKWKLNQKWKIIKQIVCDDFFEEFTFTKFRKNKDWIEFIDYVTFSKFDLINAFEKYGGSFVQSLWHCLVCADPINTKKIMETFSDYVEQYVFEFIKSDKKNDEISKWSVEVKE